MHLRHLSLAVLGLAFGFVGCDAEVAYEPGTEAQEQALERLQSACEDLCEIPACAAAEEDCVSACEALYLPGCGEEAEAMIRCAPGVIENKCELEGDMCEPEHTAYKECDDQNS